MHRACTRSFSGNGTVLLNMNSFFAGKKYLVTGASRGIGRALAKELSKAGGEVYALSRTKDTLDSLAKENDRIYPIIADVSDWDLTRSIVEKMDCLDGVVNNAAFGPQHMGFANANDCPRKWYETALNTNTLAAINIIQTTGQKMIKRGKGGSIVNVSSMLGIYPMNGSGFYNISKAALDMVTKQFALELGPHQIRVNSVNPTMVNTASVLAMPEYNELANAIKTLIPLRRICTEQECVHPIMYLLSERASMVTGIIHVVDGGMTCSLVTVDRGTLS